jgi:HAD superfamily hydrolase (TIGR01509 family)
MQMKHPYTGIIFDCDGVLFESRRANLAYYNAILVEFGEAPVDENELERTHLCHTAASPQVLGILLGEERAAAALDFAAGLDYRRFIPEMHPEPGMQEVLAILSSRFPIGVATNRGASMPEIIRHFNLGDHFHTVVTSRDVPRPKPYPDMLLEASRRMQIPPRQLLFIGDSELDQAAAQAAGITFAAYKQPLQADLRFESFAEMLGLLEDRFST